MEEPESNRTRIIEWLGGHELTVLTGMLIVTGGVWIYVALSTAVMGGTLDHFDESVVRSMRQPDDAMQPRGPDWFNEMARDITAMGGYTILLIIILGVSGFLWLNKKYYAMWFLIAATITGYLFMMSLKVIMDRPRPDFVSQLSHTHSASFPSGHSMMAAIVYLTCGALLTRMSEKRRIKFYFLAVPMLITLLVGMSRVYMGVHFPTDVLAGWTAGLVWATACWLMARWMQNRGWVDQSL